jgi:hypothetical protein
MQRTDFAHAYDLVRDQVETHTSGGKSLSDLLLEHVPETIDGDVSWANRKFLDIMSESTLFESANAFQSKINAEDPAHPYPDSEFFPTLTARQWLDLLPAGIDLLQQPQSMTEKERTTAAGIDAFQKWDNITSMGHLGRDATERKHNRIVLEFRKSGGKLPIGDVHDVCTTAFTEIQKYG